MCIYIYILPLVTILLFYVGGGGGGSRSNLRGQTEGGRLKNLKNIDRIRYGGGSLLLILVIGGSVGCKGKHHSFPLQRVIYCDNGISTHLLLKSRNRLYKTVST